jgi:hypothetical protein
VSFDIFLQRFVNGKAVDADGDSMLAILEPLITARSGGWARIITADGHADVYGIDDPASGLVINHASGRAVWDVVFELARAAGMAVMPVGCRTSVTDPGLIDALPAGSPRAEVVTSGADILATVEDA